MSKTASIAALFLFTIAALAEVDIPEKDRVKNLPTGCCCWCSIENLARIHNVKQLHGITKRRHDQAMEQIFIADEHWEIIEGQNIKVTEYWRTRNNAAATPQMVRDQLTELKVKHQVQDQDNYDMTIVLNAIKNNQGCAIALRDWPLQGSYHMVTLTDIDDEKIVFIENRGTCDRYLGTRQWFNEHWSGFTVVIHPND